MNFLQPLGLLLALALPLIVILHLRKQQLMEKDVSSLILWDQVIREAQGVKTRRINRYLLLLLQLLIGALVVAALARPVLTAPFGGGEITVALDCSLSMQAAEGAGTRLQTAREELTDYLAALPDDVRVNLVLLQKKSRLALEQAPKKEVMEAVAHTTGTSEALDLEMAAGLLDTCPTPRVVFTDKELPLGDRRVMVGGVSDNLGITGGAYDYYSHTVLCRVKNYGPHSRTAVLGLEDRQARRDVQRVDIPAGREVDVTWPGPEPGAQLLRVTILNQDALPADNSFLLPVGEEFKKKVLVVGGDGYLQNALSSLPWINLTITQGWDEAQGEYDLYIMGREPPAGLLPGGAGAWWLSPPAEMLAGRINGPAALEVSPGPLARDLDLREARAVGCPALKPRAGHRVALTAAGQPVITKSYPAGPENNGVKGGRQVFSTLNGENTNLPRLPAYPILVENILQWFFAEDIPWRQPGDLLYPVEGKTLRLEGPGGFAGTLAQMPLTLDKPGVYYVSEGNVRVKTLLVNPPPGFTAGEPPETTGRKTGVAAGGGAPPLKLQNILLVLALVLLAAEWQVYRRDL
ncbi:MAG: VWA domain-containing protein [Firmicutes bacterium]|nr:VWA domain-containing protein [Bacillota bacterium]